jgi:hypothetical protein
MRAAAALVAVAAAMAAPPAPKGGSPSIRVPLVAAGAPVAAGELKAAVDGTEARVASVRTPGDEMILTVVLDLTGDLTLASVARQALTEGIQPLPPKTWISVMRANDGLRVLLDPTEDRTKVAETVQATPVSGKAGLLDTIETVTRLSDAVLARANVRLAVLYVTDSNIYGYREDFTNPVINSSDSRDMSRHFPEGLVKDKISKLDARLSSRQTPVFIVHLEYRSDRLNEAYQSGLMQLAATTGGGAVFCRSTTEVGPTIAKMLETVRSLHTVTVELPRKTGRSIQVQLEAGGRPLSYRNRFWLEGRK